MEVIKIKTSKKKEIIDITEDINKIIINENRDKGACILFLLHTTAGLTTADLDPGTDLDMLDAFEEMVPKLRFRHPHNPAHAKDHIMSSILGASIVLPIERGRLVLGDWQRVVLVELDGPNERKIKISFLKF